MEEPKRFSVQLGCRFRILSDGEMTQREGGLVLGLEDVAGSGNYVF